MVKNFSVINFLIFFVIEFLYFFVNEYVIYLYLFDQMSGNVYDVMTQSLKMFLLFI